MTLTSPLEGFHPAVRAWFERTFGSPTDAQLEGSGAFEAARTAPVPRTACRSAPLDPGPHGGRQNWRAAVGRG